MNLTALLQCISENKKQEKDVVLLVKMAAEKNPINDVEEMDVPALLLSIIRKNWQQLFEYLFAVNDGIPLYPQLVAVVNNNIVKYWDLLFKFCRIDMLKYLLRKSNDGIPVLPDIYRGIVNYVDIRYLVVVCKVGAVEMVKFLLMRNHDGSPVFSVIYVSDHGYGKLSKLSIDFDKILHDLVINGRVVIIKLLLSSKINVNSILECDDATFVTFNDKTALIEACSRGHLEMVQLLLNKRRQKGQPVFLGVNAKDLAINNNEALRKACQRRDIIMVSYLLSRNDTDIPVFAEIWEVLLADRNNGLGALCLLGDLDIVARVLGEFLAKNPTKKNNSGKFVSMLCTKLFADDLEILFLQVKTLGEDKTSAILYEHITDIFYCQPELLGSHLRDILEKYHQKQAAILLKEIAFSDSVASGSNDVVSVILDYTRIKFKPLLADVSGTQNAKPSIRKIV